jgi:cystathionine beta-lyase/cystathionine gamma-synthase
MQSNNFVFDNLTDFRKAFEDEMDANLYPRGNNPTVAILRKKLATLEKAEAFFHRLKRFSLAVSGAWSRIVVFSFCGFYNIPGK